MTPLKEVAWLYSHTLAHMKGQQLPCEDLSKPARIYNFATSRCCMATEGAPRQLRIPSGAPLRIPQMKVRTGATECCLNVCYLEIPRPAGDPHACQPRAVVTAGYRGPQHMCAHAAVQYVLYTQGQLYPKTAAPFHLDMIHGAASASKEVTRVHDID